MRNDIHEPSNIQLRAAQAEARGRRRGASQRAAVAAALITGFASGCLGDPELSEEGAAELESLGEVTQEMVLAADGQGVLGASTLTLLNGWTHAPSSTRSARVSLSYDGIVRLEGAIANGTHPVAFTLPSAYRPVTNVYVPVDLCNARKGRLHIPPSGDVWIQAEGVFSDAQCFTSLEGVSFLLGTPSYKLTLQNGWVHAPYGTRDAGVSLSPEGIVRLRGGIGFGTSAVAFTLPTAYRPATNVYALVDLSDGKKGRLFIKPDGTVSVQTKGPFSDAMFTSLEGASFAVSTASFTPLALQNGWTHAPYGTRNAAVTNDAGIIRFAGAIANGASSVVFTLPGELRPPSMVYIPVDLCNAAKGRLIVQPSGVVSVQAEGAFSSAQCFTSLEGAWFAL